MLLFDGQEEINAYMRENAITSRGRNCPKPVFSFEEACFPGGYKSHFHISQQLGDAIQPMPMLCTLPRFQIFLGSFDPFWEKIFL